MNCASLQNWDGSGVFLLRMDYGYDPRTIVGGRWSREAIDLSRGAIGSLCKSLGPEVRVITGADRLLALNRRRGGDEWLEALARVDRRGLLLVARFPRTSQKLAILLKERGLFAGSDALEPTGEIPPLYETVGLKSEIGRLHLALEWETGLAQARGASVLEEAAGLMADVGEGTPSQLAARLGTTTGAARSYFSWMIEAGLARKTAKGYALRHPGLALLFLDAKAEAPHETAAAPEVHRPAPPTPPPPPAPSSKPAPRRWDPSEMD